MRIPRTFKLFGETIKVVFKSNLKYKELDLNGFCDPDNNKIYLRTNLEKQYLEATFYHELTHMLFLKIDENKLSANEKLISCFSGLLNQFLKTRKY